MSRATPALTGHDAGGSPKRRAAGIGAAVRVLVAAVAACFLPLAIGGRPHVAVAGMNVWTSNGPTDGTMPVEGRALAVDPTTPGTVYAGTSGAGIFKSIDGGSTWNLTTTGEQLEYVVTLATDPTGTVYAAAGRVFKSSDGGSNWTDTGSPGTTLYGLAVEPSAPGMVYGCANYYARENALISVIRSPDGGASWQPAATGLSPATCAALAVDPRTPCRGSGLRRTCGTVYSGLNGMGVGRSINHGRHWRHSLEGVVYALAVDPTSPGGVYAGTFGGGVYKSTDGGGSWSAADAGLVNGDPSNRAGLVFAVAADPVTPGTVYAGTNGAGVFKSTDGGMSWSAFNAGLSSGQVNNLGIDSAYDVYSLAIDPTTATLYAATDAGVFDVVQ